MMGYHGCMMVTNRENVKGDSQEWSGRVGAMGCLHIPRKTRGAKEQLSVLSFQTKVS